MDLKTFGRMFLGRKPGQWVSDKDMEQDKRAYDYYIKKNIDQVMTVQQPVQPPQFMSLTNSEGRVIDVLVKPDGTPQVVEPRVQNTQQGLVTMVNPTNAVPVVNPNTQQPYMGYAADPMSGAPMPGIGGAGMAVTNSPTAAPSPTPQQLREGSTVRQNGVTYRIVNGQPVVVP